MNEVNRGTNRGKDSNSARTMMMMIPGESMSSDLQVRISRQKNMFAKKN
jgi:hypothetical protein